MTMAEWASRLDAFLAFNDRDVLANAGRVAHDAAKRIAHERFEAFDTGRRTAEARAADIEHVEEMLRLTEELKPDQKRSP